MTTASWSDLLGSRDKRHEYTEAILELASGKEEALSTWIYINELVAFLRRDGNPQEWSKTSDYLDTVYLESRTPCAPPLRLPRTVLDSLEPILPLSSFSSTDYPTIRLTLIESIRAGLEYLERNVGTLSISPYPSTPLREEIMFLFEKERNVDFPTPPSPTTRRSIMRTAREPPHEGSTQTIASLLLNHYAFSARNPTTASSRLTSATDEEELSGDEDNADTRSIHTGIKEARESIVRKEDKLRWLLGENFHKGPQSRSSTTTSSNATTSSSTTSSASSHSTVRGRPVSTTPTTSRVVYQEESSSTIGALPEFPPTSSSSTFEPRGSVDSYAASTIDPRGSLSTHRHSRLISTSSSTSPLLASARPSTVSTRETPPPPPPPPLSPHRRVFSTGGLSNQPPYSFDRSSTPLTSNLVDRPTPPSPTSSSSRPFSHLYDLHSPHNQYPSTSRTSKRHSLDSAKDQLSSSSAHNNKRDLTTSGATPFDCQELSERDKSELVWRNKKLEKLLGSRVHQQGSSASGFGSVKVQRRRAVSDEVELMNGGAGVSGGERERERERELRRPVSIVVPGLNLGGVARVSGGAEEEKAPVSPTTIVPVETTRQSPSNDSSNPTRPSMMMHRSSSTPTSPLSPTTPLDQELPCSSSSSSLNRSISNSTSTTKTTRPIMNHHSNSYTSTSSTSSATSTTTTVEEQEKREERRKKLEKVRRVLGERVPLGLVVELKPQLYDYEQHEQTGSGTGMGKSKSRQMGERLKEVFRPDSPTTAGGGKGKKGRGSEQDRENWVGTQSAPQFGGGGGGGGYEKKNVRSSGDRGVQGVEALTKARKLESLFGDLPPQSLYLAPTSSTQGNHPPTRSPLLLHRRSHSDLGVTRSGSVSTTSSSMNGSARGSFDSDLCRTRSNSSSMQSYRRSIASLRYVMEQDPTALDEVVRAYAGGGATHPRDSDEGQQRHSLSTSTTSHAAVRKAQKLSSFFGTTKGEVWKRLLDDIASAVREDEELEDEERQEVLESLDKLREGTQTYPHQPTQQFHQHRQQQIQQLEQLQI